MERLRTARELRGLSQAELAIRAGLQPSAVSHFEAGRRTPSAENLKKIADALDVTTDYLLERVDKSERAAFTTGPVADRLFRCVERISETDLESLAQMAEVLARKKTSATV